jgi:hypothetical protein
MIDFERTIISQFANSPVITQLVSDFNDCIDQTINFNNFLQFVWNVDTATGFGLDIWGRIVAISRSLLIPSEIDVFGFDVPDDAWQPFNQAPFYSGSTAGPSSVYILSDDLYRKLILTKALANISDNSIPSMNRILRNFFADRGKCYMKVIGTMKLQYFMQFTLEPFERAAILSSGAFPVPAGVSVEISDGNYVELLDTLEMLDELELGPS